jgi:6-phosphogluconolactonase
MEKLTRRSFLVYASAASLASRWAFAADPEANIMFVGTVTDNKSTSKGIYAFRWDADAGVAHPLGLAAETPDPEFLAISPDRRYLYAANETREYKGSNTGSVSAFLVDPKSGMLTLRNIVSSQASMPNNVTVDHTGKVVFVTDGAGATLASFRVLADGSLSEAVSTIHFTGHSVNPRRQKAPWTHCVTVSPDNQFLLVNDLGLDRVTTFRFDPATAVLTPNQLAFYQAIPGSGPRSLAFHSKGRWVYALNEMGSSIDAMTWDSRKGVLTRFQNISTLPAGFSGENTAGTVCVESGGRFLYASNRGADNVAVFSIAPSSGFLSQIQHVPCGGKTPRHIALDPSQRWLLVSNQTSATVAILGRNPRTGFLEETKNQCSVDFPVCVAFA